MDGLDFNDPGILPKRKLRLPGLIFPMLRKFPFFCRVAYTLCGGRVIYESDINRTISDEAMSVEFDKAMCYKAPMR